MWKLDLVMSRTNQQMAKAYNWSPSCETTRAEKYRRKFLFARRPSI